MIERAQRSPGGGEELTGREALRLEEVDARMNQLAEEAGRSQEALDNYLEMSREGLPDDNPEDFSPAERETIFTLYELATDQSKISNKEQRNKLYTDYLDDPTSPQGGLSAEERKIFGSTMDATSFEKERYYTNFKQHIGMALMNGQQLLLDENETDPEKRYQLVSTEEFAPGPDQRFISFRDINEEVAKMFFSESKEEEDILTQEGLIQVATRYRLEQASTPEDMRELEVWIGRDLLSQEQTLYEQFVKKAKNIDGYEVPSSKASLEIQALEKELQNFSGALLAYTRLDEDTRHQPENVKRIFDRLFLTLELLKTNKNLARIPEVSIGDESDYLNDSETDVINKFRPLFSSGEILQADIYFGKLISALVGYLPPSTDEKLGELRTILRKELMQDIQSENSPSFNDTKKEIIAIFQEAFTGEGKSVVDFVKEATETTSDINNQIFYEAAALNFSRLTEPRLSHFSSTLDFAELVEDAAESTAKYHHGVLDLSNVEQASQDVFEILFPGNPNVWYDRVIIDIGKLKEGMPSNQAYLALLKQLSTYRHGHIHLIKNTEPFSRDDLSVLLSSPRYAGLTLETDEEFDFQLFDSLINNKGLIELIADKYDAKENVTGKPEEQIYPGYHAFVQAHREGIMFRGDGAETIPERTLWHTIHYYPGEITVAKSTLSQDEIRHMTDPQIAATGIRWEGNIEEGRQAKAIGAFRVNAAVPATLIGIGTQEMDEFDENTHESLAKAQTQKFEVGFRDISQEHMAIWLEHFGEDIDGAELVFTNLQVDALPDLLSALKTHQAEHGKLHFDKLQITTPMTMQEVRDAGVDLREFFSYVDEVTLERLTGVTVAELEVIVNRIGRKQYIDLPGIVFDDLLKVPKPQREEGSDEIKRDEQGYPLYETEDSERITIEGAREQAKQRAERIRKIIDRYSDDKVLISTSLRESIEAYLDALKNNALTDPHIDYEEAADLYDDLIKAQTD